MRFVESLATRISIASELLGFFWHHKWWWLTPVVVVLLLLGLLVVFAQTSAIAPFIYTLF